MSDRADLQVMSADERLKRIEVELQHIKMLMTQTVKHLGLKAVPSTEAMMAVKDRDD